MEVLSQDNYKKMERAVAFLKTYQYEQPDLQRLAKEINMSPFHFQRMFTRWVGISPKKFQQYLNVNYAKSIMYNEQQSLFETALRTGLSGGGRLHDLFVKIEGMTPGEYRQGGQGMIIKYNVFDSPFGQVMIASTERGICFLSFIECMSEDIDALRGRFPNATLQEERTQMHERAMSFFAGDYKGEDKVRFHLKGTPFQLKVWEALLKIPEGKLTTYGQIGIKIGYPSAARAIGTAIGSNPIAYIIPCHRVIRQSGLIGGYRWGIDRKLVMIGYEASKIHY